MAQNLSTSPSVSDRVTACKLAKTSLWVSVAGMVVGTIFLIVLIILMVNKLKKEWVHECQLMGGHYDYERNHCRY